MNIDDNVYWYIYRGVSAEVFIFNTSGVYSDAVNEVGSGDCEVVKLEVLY